MSSKSQDPALHELLESRRLGTLGHARHRFTVSREEGLMRLREQSREREDSRWAWTSFMVRAANVSSPHAQAQISVERVEAKPDDLRVTSFDVIVPGLEFDELDLSDLLAGALAADLGLPFTSTEDEVDLDQRLGRFRVLIGRAINGALAHGPRSIELETPVGGRRFELREQPVEGRDPYAERKIGACQARSRFVLRVTEVEPGLTSKIGRWFRGRGEVNEELAQLWKDRQLADHALDEEGDEGGFALGPALEHPSVVFGSLARYGPLAGLESVPERLRGSLWLVREGVILIDLGPALTERGLDMGASAGWIDCPTLRLTADEASVVHNGSFETLVAWIYDYQAHADEAGAVTWPASLSAGVKAANGEAITTDQLAESAHRGRELVYVWRHRAGTVPSWTRSRIAALWPSEELLLRERLPELRLVPLRALGQTDVDPADLTSLRQGCFEAIALVKHSPLGPEDEGGGSTASVAAGLRVSVEAFVHRSPTANNGFVVILAYERRVAQIHESGKVFPGVTLICRVSGESESLDIAALRRDHATITAIAERCRSLTHTHWEALLAQVMSQANPWENPLLRTALLELHAGSLQLRYQRTDYGLRLAWRNSILLDVELGQDGEGQRKTLRDALRSVRERGCILVAHPRKRYSPLRSQDPLLRPWVLDHDTARALLLRVVGRAAVLDMPVVPEAHPLVVEDPVDDQRHLLREPATIQRERERCASDPLARLRLLGHLLVSRGLDQPPVGLESVALLERYDPRAQHPSRLVSLAAVLQEQPRPGLVPAGTVHRQLPRPMLEVLPGVAALLAEVDGFEPGLTSAITMSARPIVDARGAERSSTTPVRRRGRALRPLLARSVIDPLLIGRLSVAGDLSVTGIGLWSGGLRVGELELHEPLKRVSGRLVLTPQGQRVGATTIRERATEYARSLLADAPRQRTLLPPGQTQRVHLDHFVEYVRAALRVDDRYKLGEAFGLAQPRDAAARVVALREMSLRAVPLRPLGTRREALLVDVVRQSLAMAVHFDTAMLSWRPAKLRRRRRDGSFELEFGLRNSWIQRGLDEDRDLEPDAHRRAALYAGLFVVAAFFEQAHEREDTELGPEHLDVALWRLLELS